jgi:ribulose-phosphate 3-epimerase
MSEVVPKIAEAKKLIDERGLLVSIEVDGGIDEKTAVTVAEAGARVFVSGHAIFSDERPWEAVERIRSAVIGAFDRGAIT